MVRPRVLTEFTYYANVSDVVVAAGRRGLVPFYETVGFELYDGEVGVPEGGTEELVRMTYRQDD
ncbi:MAG: hypothetical protein V5A62_15190 [Haloarculaceae archaeon]